MGVGVVGGDGDGDGDDEDDDDKDDDDEDDRVNDGHHDDDDDDDNDGHHDDWQFPARRFVLLIFLYVQSCVPWGFLLKPRRECDEATCLGCHALPEACALPGGGAGR